MWERFKKGCSYYIGIDPCEAVGKDFSVISVIKQDGNLVEQVAEFRGFLNPKKLADKAFMLAKMYKNDGGILPLMAPERNNHGHAVILRLQSDEIAYDNLYYAKDRRAGWITTTATRPLMLDAFIDGVHDRILKMNSVQTLKECLTFVNVVSERTRFSRFEAEKGYFDDGIVASSIAFKVLLEYNQFGKLEIF